MYAAIADSAKALAAVGGLTLNYYYYDYDYFCGFRAIPVKKIAI